jgi:hypothetical protein
MKRLIARTRCSSPAQVRPFPRREDAGDDVEGDDPLGRLLLAIDGEGNAERTERGLGGLLAALQLGGRQVLQPGGDGFEIGARGLAAAVAPKLVERPPFRHRPSLLRRAACAVG